MFDFYMKRLKLYSGYLLHKRQRHARARLHGDILFFVGTVPGRIHFSGNNNLMTRSLKHTVAVSDNKTDPEKVSSDFATAIRSGRPIKPVSGLVAIIS